MNKSDIATIIGILRTAYPVYYKDKSSVIDTTALWYEMFQNENLEALKIAVKNFITNSTSGFPPTIGEIKNEIYKLYNGDEKEDIELWNELKSAIRHGIYYAEEMFPSLSKEVQLFLGNPASLRELSTMSAEEIDTVQKGIFLKQIPIIKQREKEKQMMLPESRELINNLLSKWDSKKYLGE